MNETLKQQLIAELRLRAWQSTAIRGKNQRERDRQDGRESAFHEIANCLEQDSLLNNQDNRLGRGVL